MRHLLMLLLACAACAPDAPPAPVPDCGVPADGGSWSASCEPVCPLGGQACRADGGARYCAPRNDDRNCGACGNDCTRMECHGGLPPVRHVGVCILAYACVCRLFR